MSLFLSYPLPLTGPIVSSSWSPSQKYFAAGLSNGEVVIFNEEGERLDRFQIRKASVQPAVIAWHPSKTILAIGWSDGTVSVYTDSDKRVTDGAAKHSAAVSLVSWSPEGRRLLSGDDAGTLAVWKVDSRGAFQPIAKYSVKGKITHCCFRTVLGAKQQPQTMNIECPPFFFATESGKVYVADDAGHYTEVFSMQFQLAALLFMESRQALVAITKNAIMSIHRLSTVQQPAKDNTAPTARYGFTISQVARVKISASASDGVASACWVGTGVLAYVSHESIIRMWDIHHEENFTLRAFGGTSGSALTSLAYNPKRRVVAAGSADGRVVLFEFRGNEKSPRGADDWVLIEELAVQQGGSNANTNSSTTKDNKTGFIKHMLWGPGTRLLVAQTATGVTIFFENKLQRCMNPQGVCAIQVSSSVVQVSNGNLAPSAPQNSSSMKNSTSTVEFSIDCGEGVQSAIRIKGISISAKYVAMYDSKRIHIHALDTQKRVGILDLASISALEPLASKQEAASQSYFSACALHPFDDYLFIIRDSNVEMRSFEGGLVHTFTFSPDVEGIPVQISVSFGSSSVCNFGNNSSTAQGLDTSRCGFLSVVTDRSWLKVFSLAGREPRNVGIPRVLCPDDPESLRSMALNSAGNRVAFLRNNASIMLEIDTLATHFNMPQLLKEGSLNDISNNPNKTAGGVRGSVKMIPGNSTASSVSVSASKAGASGASAPSLQLCGTSNPSADLLLLALRNANNCLFVYDLEEDKIFIYWFGLTRYLELAARGSGGQPSEAAVSTESLALLPIDTACWDPNEVRMVSAQVVQEVITEETSLVSSKTDTGSVYVCFVTSENGIALQDTVTFPSANATALVGICVPYIVSSSTHGRRADLQTSPTSAAPSTSVRPVWRQYLRDFVGLENLDLFVDAELRRALLDFSFYLAIGNMDDAFKAVRKVFSSSSNTQNVGLTLWRNMAKMSVQTRKLDVAEMCIRRMGLARSVSALHESSETSTIPPAVIAALSGQSLTAADAATAEKDKAAKLGSIAVELGMFDVAEKIYKESDRWDLVSKLYMLTGRWEDAVSTAKEHDRIHLRTVQYLFARELENNGSIDKAVKAYEMAQVHSTEVPRMLYAANKIADLQKYVEGYKPASGEDSVHRSGLLTWWASYLEATGSVEASLPFYQQAGDFVSAVRVLCVLGRFNDAEQFIGQLDRRKADVGSGSGNSTAAASYLLARHLEDMAAEDISPEASSLRQRSIHAYAVAGQYRQAIRLARLSGLDQDLMTLALQGDKTTKKEAAQFFEENGSIDKAVILYQKAGMLGRAVQMCIDRHLFDVLDSIVQELLREKAQTLASRQASSENKAVSAGADTADDESASNIDPSLWARCGEFFMSHGKFERAAELYVAGGMFEKSMEVCKSKNVPIREEFAENVTTLLDSLGDAPRRNAVLLQLAEVAARQGQHHLATKKFTQAGDRIRAMQVLVQSGDVEKIVFFANVSKQRELYMLAANHLQNMDWRNDPSIMKHIVALYSKAKAPEALAAFYEACAQVEIDDYRDYDRALAALREAEKYLSKSRNREKRGDDLLVRIERVERFVHARAAIANNDPEEMVRVCCGLIDELRAAEARGGTQSSAALRLGDVFALLVEYYVSVGQSDKSRDLVQQMRQLRIRLDYFLGPELVDSLVEGSPAGPTTQGRARGTQPPAGRAVSGQGRGNVSDDEQDSGMMMEEEVVEDDETDSFAPRSGRYGGGGSRSNTAGGGGGHGHNPRASFQRHTSADEDVVQEEEIVDDDY
eukprot:ANDGO_05238.mRNA.1 hypothetical protein AURANDRAFT_71429